MLRLFGTVALDPGSMLESLGALLMLDLTLYSSRFH